MIKHQKTILFLEPVFKKTIWGGNRLRTEFGYDISGNDIGECWGIAAHANGDTVVKTEPYAGKTLSELWKEKPELFGNLNNEETFPLLTKIIDAKEDLSIQVHPNDEYAKKNENGAIGKTECWYILDCPKDASLVLGHNAKTHEEVKKMIANRKWNEFLRYVPIHKGDFMQINSGNIHAITKGCLILEIQQNCDLTYRVYDYERLSNGKKRELHIDKSIDVITVPSEQPQDMIKNVNQLPKNQWNELISCLYYKVFQMKLSGKFIFEQKYPFLCISVVEGKGTLNGQEIKKGDHFILPSEYGKTEIIGEMELIAASVKV